MKRRIVMALICLSMVLSSFNFALAEEPESQTESSETALESESTLPESREAIEEALPDPKIVGWDEGRKHFYDENGNPKTGLFYIGKYLYVADPEGNVQYNTIYTYNGKKYYAKDDAVVKKGPFTYNGINYVADENGVIQYNGFVTVFGKKYYVKANGDRYIYTIRRIDGKKYCFGRSDGRVMTGPFTFNRVPYVADSDGVMKFGGFVTVNGRKYYAQSNGRRYIYTKRIIGRYTYCFSKSDGRVMTGKFTYKGKTYVAQANGRIRFNRFVTINGKTYRTLKGSGIVSNGFHSFDGYHNVYYFDKNGVLIKTPFRYKGETIKPDPKTGRLSLKEYMKGYNKGTFVVVDIKDQKAYLYKNNKLILRSRVITGMKGKFDTPTGMFKVMNKKTDYSWTVYSVFVKYYLRYNPYSVLHDASWHRNFGGTLYYTRGSHGCVNLPTRTARIIYENAPIGTPVIVRP